MQLLDVGLGCAALAVRLPGTTRGGLAGGGSRHCAGVVEHPHYREVAGGEARGHDDDGVVQSPLAAGRSSARRAPPP